MKPRSAFSKFRLGVAPIQIETGRYDGLRFENRMCPFCANNTVERELHVFINCALYRDLRGAFLIRHLVEIQILLNCQTDKCTFLVFQFKHDKNMCQNMLSYFTETTVVTL